MAEEHKTKIVVEGDVSGAVSGLGKLSSAFKSVAKVASTVTRALGIIGFAVHGVQALIEAYKKVQGWLNRAATAAKELRREYEATHVTTQVALQEAAYKKLNDELSKTLALEKERNALADASTRRERDIEDAEREKRKQDEIAGLDVEDHDYDVKKSAIERKYERQGSDAAKWRSSEDARLASARYYDEADAVDGAIAELKKKQKAALENENRAIDEAHRVYMEERKGGKDAEKSDAYQAAKKRADAAYDTRVKLDKDIEAKTNQADILRAKGDEAAKGADAASIRDEANQTRITNDERREAAKRKQEAEKKQAEEDEKKAEEDKKSAEDIEKAKKAGLKERFDRKNAADEKRLGELQEFASANANAGGVGVSQNRLTAMGLGAGVSAPITGMSRDIHAMVDLLKAQIEATKKLQRYELGGDSGSTF